MLLRWIVGSVMLAGAAAGSPVFDKPMTTKVIALSNWDPSNAQAKPKRSCHYYPNFVVKETDLGEKGADELSITPLNGTKPPACAAKIKGEIVVKGDDWAGYFLGVKGPYVFFNSDDGYQGGFPFAVYSGESGKKLFDDSRQGDNFRSVTVAQSDLVMRYRRVLLAPCSLYTDAPGCWKKITMATGLPDNARPDCTKVYKDEMARTPKYAADVVKARSVVAYNAEARYAGGKFSVKALPGPAACWMED